MMKTSEATASPGHKESLRQEWSQNKVLRNTYALLSMTLFWSAGVSALTLTMGWPTPGFWVSLIGMLGLLFLVHATAESALGLVSVFAFTGFAGYMLTPTLAHHLAFEGGGAIVGLALAGTATTFLALSAYALISRRHFESWGAPILIALVVILALAVLAYLLEVPALAILVSIAVIPVSMALILFETSAIIHGGETNYIRATVGLFVALYNLFASLLNLLGLLNE